MSTDAIEPRVADGFQVLDRLYTGLFERIVSFHNPPVAVLRRSYEEFYSTYQEKFFGDIKHLSDSNRRWREGSPGSWFDAAHHPKFSISLYPAIWAYPGTDTPTGMRHYLDHLRVRARHQLRADDVWVD
jgi:hypothetical protein